MNPQSTLLVRGRALASVFFLSIAVSALAADAAVSSTTNKKDPADSDIVALQRFVVTGSNILRLDMEKVVPVTVLNTDAMEARNALAPVDLLTSLPQVINLPENETRTGSSGARAATTPTSISATSAPPPPSSSSTAAAWRSIR